MCMALSLMLRVGVAEEGERKREKRGEKRRREPDNSQPIGRKSDAKEASHGTAERGGSSS